VRSARANPWTGSVVVCFDPELMDAQAILAWLGALLPNVPQTDRAHLPILSGVCAVDPTFGASAWALRDLTARKDLTHAARWVSLLVNLPWIRQALHSYLRPQLVDLLLHALDLLGALLCGEWPSLVLAGLNALLRLASARPGLAAA
jgi:hypothetical protein